MDCARPPLSPGARLGLGKSHANHSPPTLGTCAGMLSSPGFGLHRWVGTVRGCDFCSPAPAWRQTGRPDHSCRALEQHLASTFGPLCPKNPGILQNYRHARSLPHPFPPPLQSRSGLNHSQVIHYLSIMQLKDDMQKANFCINHHWRWMDNLATKTRKAPPSVIVSIERSEIGPSNSP
jgi:hypothetical protein